MESITEYKINSPFALKVIYVFRINDEAHDGKLKIGDAEFTSPFENNDQSVLDINDNDECLNASAKKRINEYTTTAGIVYDLLYTTLALGQTSDGKFKPLRDHNVHNVLKRSGYKVYNFGTEKKSNEWFDVDLETAKNAIKAAKEGRTSLNSAEITSNQNPIVLRKEQKDAIREAKRVFSKKKVKNPKFLWNCKMRFGKTVSALSLVKEMHFQKTLIITHRPVVNEGWYEDFKKVFYEKDTSYIYSSKKQGEANLKDVQKQNKPFVYFASIQDLRESEILGGKYNKNDEVFNENWDLVVIDEAHEGTQTDLGNNVLDALKKEGTRFLHLSGTPFNLLEKGEFADGEIYTWDYIEEQKAKQEWEENPHYDENGCEEDNPYASLPHLNILTYDLEKEFPIFVEDNESFSFQEFFRVDDNGIFVHDSDIRAFLDLLCDENSNYPFSNEKYRNYFYHTFWVLPGVKEANALEKLLNEHSVFGNSGNYKIINVAGNMTKGDEVESMNALDSVKNAIKKYPYTITLSCGRLTTGVTIPEWTAVFMLSGNYNTSLSSYMQTIFRVQSSCVLDNGLLKTECYAFDFAPDRTLKVVADAVSRLNKDKNILSEEEDRSTLEEFLNFCPVIAFDGSSFKEYDVASLMRTLKKVYIERVVRNGFDDTKIYNNDYLLKLSKNDIEKFNSLNRLIGKTQKAKKITDILINDEGFTNENRDDLDTLNTKEKKGEKLTDDEKKKLEELKKKQKEEKLKIESAISIMRGISIRIPLLMYGSDVHDEDKELNVDNFTTLIDDDSWSEFMPHGVTKEMFDDLKNVYDKDIFLASSKLIREETRSLDEKTPLERIKHLSYIFSTFRNPDKETVLTPWRVVNMHLGRTLGGYIFYNKDFTEQEENPHYKNIENITPVILNENAHILDINSKTGLYLLYCGYTIFKDKIDKLENKNLTLDEENAIWSEVVKNNLFALSKTPMALKITRRTLLGFKNGVANVYFEKDIVSKVKKSEEREKVSKILKDVKTWEKECKNQKENTVNFDCVVGNPPYQEMDGGHGASAGALYNYYYYLAEDTTSKCIDLIMPSRWMTGGKGLDDFRRKMLLNNHIRILHDHISSKNVFSNVDIKGGVCYFLYDNAYKGDVSWYAYTDDKKGQVEKELRPISYGDNDIVIRDRRMLSILEKVNIFNEPSFEKKVSPRKPYGLSGDTFTAGAEKYHLPPFSHTPIKGGYKILGLDEKQKRVYKYVDKNYPFPKKQGLDKYKIFISESYGCGEIGEGPATPVLATPGEACSETFIQVYPSNDKNEVKNVIKYIKTRFFRLLVGIKKISQHATQKVYRYVPLQDFSENSPIDWSLSISEIDKQLYKKYGLSKEDIAFIETNVKEMK